MGKPLDDHECPDCQEMKRDLQVLKTFVGLIMLLIFDSFNNLEYIGVKGTVRLSNKYCI